VKFFYFKKNDPRIVIYHHPKHKWLGGTLNLAHPMTWRLFLLGSIFPVLLIISIVFFKINILTVHPAMIVLAALWQILIGVYVLRIIIRDAKGNPSNETNQSP